MQYKISSAMATGTLHSQSGLDIEDRVHICRTDTVICGVLADGAGSRASSALGAETVTEAMAQLLSEAFEEQWALSPGQRANCWVNHCLTALERQTPPLYDMGCTLLCYAAHKDGRYLSGHIGDGIMVLYSEGELLTFSDPENGAYPNETYLVTDEDAVVHLRLQQGCRSAGGTLLMMSDGTADSLYIHAEKKPATACRIMAQWLQEGDEDTISQVLQNHLEQLFSRYTHDDMSLIMIDWKLELETTKS